MYNFALVWILQSKIGDCILFMTQELDCLFSFPVLFVFRIMKQPFWGLNKKIYKQWDLLNNKVTLQCYLELRHGISHYYLSQTVCKCHRSTPCFCNGSESAVQRSHRDRGSSGRLQSSVWQWFAWWVSIRFSF